MARLKSGPSVRPDRGHLENYNVSSQENGIRDTTEICGPKAVISFRNYFEYVQSSGVSVSRAARSALPVFRGALGISWPLDRLLLGAAVTVGDPPS